MEALFLQSECHPEATFYVALAKDDIGGGQWFSALCAECHTPVLAARVIPDAYRVAPRAEWKKAPRKGA